MGVVKLEDKTILIVDDSLAIRSQLKMILDKQGFDVRDVGNSIGLFNVIEEYGKLTDLIIMDIDLKEENGFDLIEKLKKSMTYSGIPIMMLTDYAQLVNVVKAKQMGIENFVRKPIDSEDLIRRVKAVLKIS